jgi:hypothetical protein
MVAHTNRHSSPWIRNVGPGTLAGRILLQRFSKRNKAIARMARPRLQKTLADYLAIGVTPILIMLLVGSLVFFLQELFFDGQRFESRTRWILFWYVIGSVLVARIAVENGRAYASVFTVGLCIAVALAIFKFVPEKPWVPLCCLGLIWWCTDKLTWDCTLIDDSEDASGEGLLQVAGVDDNAEANEQSVDSNGSSEESPVDEKKSSPILDKDEVPVPVWQRLLQNSSERSGKPHSPGLWVVYFSLAALPIFGFGQAAIPSANLESRDYAFRCLVVYVGAGLGLLMLTSFLGLRRYLRQRNLQMPSAMAASWVGFGAMIAFGILVTCLLLPRPDGEYDITDLIDKASDKIQKASDNAFLDDDGSGKGEGERSGEADENAGKGAAQNNDPNKKGQPGGKKGNNPDAKPGDEKGKNGKPKKGGEDSDQKGEPKGDQKKSGDGDQQGGNKKEDGDKDDSSENVGEKQDGDDAKNKNSEPQNDPQKDPNGEQDPGEKDNAKNQGDQQQDDQNADQKQDQENREDSDQADDNSDDANESDDSSSESESSSKMDSVFEKIGTLFKFIIYGIVICVGLFFLWKNWAAVCNFVTRLWHEFLSLFGRSPKQELGDDETEMEVPAEPAQPFSEFKNPFRSGAAQQTSPNELVRYTFEALQAWAYENDCGRSPQQTPMEFGQRLQTQELSFASEANEVSQLYARVAYASHRPTDSNIRSLEKLWRKLKA